MGIFETIKRIQKMFVQAIGSIVALVGLFLTFSNIPPQDTETIVILAIGVVMILLGVSTVRNPEKVRLGRDSNYRDKSEPNTDTNRWER